MQRGSTIRVGFGSFPMSATLHRSVYLSSSPYESLPKSTDLSLAQKEYKIALRYARKKEFKAKIAYQLLKIDLANACIAYVKSGAWGPSFGYLEEMKEVLQKDKNFNKNIKKV